MAAPAGPVNACVRPGSGFSAKDRQLLLGISGFGPQCLRRLEEAGIDSLQKLRALGADRAAELICAQLGTAAWRNRRRPIERALQHMTQP